MADWLLFGKKPILLTLVIIMAVGFAVAGSAESLYVLIIGRGTFRSPISFLMHAKGLTIAISLSGVRWLWCAHRDRDHLFRHYSPTAERCATRNWRYVSTSRDQLTTINLTLRMSQCMGLCHVRPTSSGNDALFSPLGTAL